MAYSRRSLWPTYVSAAEKRELARKAVAKLKKSGEILEPVEIQGRKIARSFWGQAWCENLEAYSDYSNRLPRGRTYVRNGSVLDLKISAGRVQAKVNGSSLYRVDIKISALPSAAWKALVLSNSGQISTIMELLEGRISEAVMLRVTDQHTGLFPKPREISFDCSCPDIAGMCKHIAAVMYGIGHRLDERPELLFVLREVDQSELIQAASSSEQLLTAGRSIGHGIDEDEDLSALFGIDIEFGDVSETRSQQKLGQVKTKTAAAHNARAVVKKATGEIAKKSPSTLKSKPSKKTKKPSKIKPEKSLSVAKTKKKKAKKVQVLAKPKKKSSAKSKVGKKAKKKKKSTK
jgi:uncharacterized Zn finger protein